MNYQEILIIGNQILKDNNIKSSNLDCELILSKVLNKTREEILTNLDNKINDIEKDQFNFYVNKRKRKNPMSYILGFKYFWKYKFYINKSVLIPRPETEQLIEQSLKYIPVEKELNILDIGTGSGCLIVSLLKERPKCYATAIDLSKEALKVAKINANMHHIENKIKFLNIDIDKFNSSKYDLIISNPPYIKKLNLRYLEKDVINFEPYLALNGGIDGLSEIRKVINRSSELIKKKGKLVLEIGFNQKNDVKKLLLRKGFYINEVIKDLANNNRCIVSTKL